MLWLVQDTSLRLRVALATEPPAAVSKEEVLRALYDHAAVVDRYLGRLRSIETSGFGNLADAVEDYLVTSREILLRRRRASATTSAGAPATICSAAPHTRADCRNRRLDDRAARARNGSKREIGTIRIASTASGGLLQSFPVVKARISPHVQVALLDRR